MNENVFYAFDVDELDFFPVIYDEINFIFFDPITEKEYDHPWVFKDLEESATLGVEVFKEYINTEQARLRVENNQQMMRTRKYYTLCNMITWFYIEPYSLDIRLCIRYNKEYKDANTNVPLDPNIIKYAKYEDCFQELITVVKTYETQRNEQLEKLRKELSKN